MSGEASAHASVAEDSTAMAQAAVTVQTQGMAAVMVPAGEAIPATALAASRDIQDMAHHQDPPALEITAALPLLPTKGIPAVARVREQALMEELLARPGPEDPSVPMATLVLAMVQDLHRHLQGRPYLP